MIFEQMRPLTRLLLVFIGLTMLAACLASSYQEWPLILSGKLPPLGFMVTLVLAIIVAIIVIIIGFVGEKRIWVLNDQGIEIKSFQFIGGGKTVLVPLEKVQSLRAMHMERGYDQHHEAHWLEIVVSPDKRLRSPIMANRDAVMSLGRDLGAKLAQTRIAKES